MQEEKIKLRRMYEEYCTEFAEAKTPSAIVVANSALVSATRILHATGLFSMKELEIIFNKIALKQEQNITK